MLPNTLKSVLVLAATASATIHGASHNAAHQVRSLNIVRDTLSERHFPVATADCDKMSLLKKVTTVVPTSLVATMLASPKPFSNDNPPEFWSKFTDEEKECLTKLYPLHPEEEKDDSKEPKPAPEADESECVETTSTVTSTIQHTVTVTMEPMGSATSSAGPVVTGSLSFQGASSPSGSMTAPWGNGTAIPTHAPTLSSSGMGNVTSQFLPEFTAGQGKLHVSFFAGAVAAGVAVAVGAFA